MSLPTGTECELYGEAPVRGDGRVDGHPFYFRARHSHWTFTVCTSHDLDPSVLRGPDSDGWFTEDDFEGFLHSGDFANASRMPYDTARQLIADSIAVFRDVMRNRA